MVTTLQNQLSQVNLLLLPLILMHYSGTISNKNLKPLGIINKLVSVLTSIWIIIKRSYIKTLRDVNEDALETPIVLLMKNLKANVLCILTRESLSKATSASTLKEVLV